MKKAVTIIQENWKDPVWSKVISAGIIAVISFILASIYALIKNIFSKVPFTESFNSLTIFFNKDIEIKIWLLILLLVFYLILITNSAKEFFNNIYLKIKTKDKQIDDRVKHPGESSTSFFYRRMASAFPGERGVCWFNDPFEATKRLNILLREPLCFEFEKREFATDPIWWFRDTSSSHIKKELRIGRRKILLNYEQLKIKRIASYRGRSDHNAFIYVEVNGEKQTGLYNNNEENIKKNIDTFGYSWEEYGLIRNWAGQEIPIRREDYDDGATVLNGKIKDTLNAKLRVRYLSRYNFIITSKGSPFNSNKFGFDSKQYMDDILQDKIDPNIFMDFMINFKRSEK